MRPLTVSLVAPLRAEVENLFRLFLRPNTGLVNRGGNSADPSGGATDSNGIFGGGDDDDGGFGDDGGYDDFDAGEGGADGAWGGGVSNANAGVGEVNMLNKPRMAQKITIE